MHWGNAAEINYSTRVMYVKSLYGELWLGLITTITCCLYSDLTLVGYLVYLLIALYRMSVLPPHIGHLIYSPLLLIKPSGFGTSCPNRPSAVGPVQE